MRATKASASGNSNFVVILVKHAHQARRGAGEAFAEQHDHGRERQRTAARCGQSRQRAPRRLATIHNHHRENDQPENIIDDRGTQNQLGLRGAAAAPRSLKTRAVYPDTRRTEGRAQKQMRRHAQFQDSATNCSQNPAQTVR